MTKKCETALAALILICCATQAAATSIYAVLQPSTLIEFDSATPSSLLFSQAITGIAAGETIAGIDFRPADGGLYALTTNASGGGSLYKIDRFTTAATLVATLTSGMSPFTGFAVGGRGIDFNPTVDRLRVVGGDDLNIRVNPNTGAVITDTTLTYAVGDPNEGANPFVLGVGYTNSFAGATTTTLYAFDYASDRLTIQNPPNAGTLNTVGSLGIVTHLPVGFDIVTLGSTQFAYLTTNISSTQRLYSIDLVTGAATLIGTIGSGLPVADIAVLPDLIFRNGYD